MSTISNLWNSILQTIGTTTTNFGGLVTAQTPTTTDSSTNVATTAYVQNNLENYLVESEGTMEDSSPYSNVYWQKTPSKMTLTFTCLVTYSSGRATVTFPIAFKEGTVPNVQFTAGGPEYNYWGFWGFQSDSNSVPEITNTNFSIFYVGWAGSFAGVSANGYVTVTAVGDYD